MGVIVQLDATGQAALPAPWRRALRLEAGDLIEVTMLEDSLVLTPKTLVDKSQTYFWTADWQAAERQAEADINAGRVQRFDRMEDLIADLDAD